MRLWENKVAADSPRQRPWENICKLSRPVLVISLRNKIHRFSTMQKLSALDNAKIMKPWTFPVLFSDYNFRKQNTNNETFLYSIKIKQIAKNRPGGKWKIKNYVEKTTTVKCPITSKNKSLHILHNSSCNWLTYFCYGQYWEFYCYSVYYALINGDWTYYLLHWMPTVYHYAITVSATEA